MKVSQAKHCRWCTDAATIDNDIRLLKMEMADCDDEEERGYLEDELTFLQTKQKKILHHLHKLQVQKEAIYSARKNIKAREAVVTMDFLSWYRKDMSKVNDCSFTVETNPTGLPGQHECKYIDVPCHDKSTNKHNHHFVAAAVHEVIFKSGLFFEDPTKMSTRKFDRIVVSCDNALVNRWTSLTWGIVQRRTGIKVEVIPGCDNHGECLVDAHGGTIKPKLKRADIQNQYPSSGTLFKLLLNKFLTLCAFRYTKLITSG